MAYTRHGHQIQGTPINELPIPNERCRCGGPGICDMCSQDASLETYRKDPRLFIKPNTDYPKPAEVFVKSNTDYPNLAKTRVLEYINTHKSKHAYETVDYADVFVVWFSKTLRNWKALVSTTVPNSAYYEVTHNGDTKETYIDVYEKTNNVVYPA